MPPSNVKEGRFEPNEIVQMERRPVRTAAGRRRHTSLKRRIDLKIFMAPPMSWGVLQA